MIIRNTIKTIAMASCMLPIAFNAVAVENNSYMDAKNFVIVKVGAVNSSATTRNNNAEVDSVDYTSLVGVELGRKITDIFSVGMEYNYKSKADFNLVEHDHGREHDSETWGVKSHSLMLNLTANLMQKSKITPYVKLGMGISRNVSNDYLHIYHIDGVEDATFTYPGKTKNNFAWQAGLGVTMDYNDRISTDVSYSFMNRGKVITQQYRNFYGKNRLHSSKTVKLQDHIIAVGLKVKF